MSRGMVIWLGALIWMCGCVGDDETTVALEQPCNQNTPLVTWETFGEGFVTTHCKRCHASTAIDRQGAPADVILDTKDDAIDWRGAILNNTASPEPRMPPNGGPVDEDRQLLAIWLTCFPD